MKKLIFPILFLMVGMTAGAQVMVGKTDINTRYVQYVEVWDKPAKTDGKYLAMVDYGQATQDDAVTNWAVNNMNGQPMEFNGVIDMLNFMYRNGWEVMTTKTTEGYESYFMKRRAGYVMPTAGISKN